MNTIMTYEIMLSPKTIALAAAGAAVLGMPLDAALLRPVVVVNDGTAKGSGELVATVRRVVEKKQKRGVRA